MDEHENLPAKMASQSLAASTEKRGSLVARGMSAVLSNTQLALTKDNDALYRVARDVWNRITDDGNKSGFGDMWSENEHVELKSAYDAFQLLADAGFGKAYFPLAIMFSVGVPGYSEDGKPVNQISRKQAQNYAKLSFNWCWGKDFPEDAAFDAESCNDLGVLYMTGEAIGQYYYLGVSPNHRDYQPNYKAALRCFKDAADAGNPSAMFNLCGMHEAGCGVEQNCSEALHWQIKAAEAGHEKAQRGLEQQHEHGDLESKIDDEQVFDWYVWSAEQGHLWAQLFLAEAYRFGDVIEQDVDESTFWFRKAAMQGSAIGQWRLGEMYILALGVVRDDEQAVYWLNKAAEQKLASGQNRLGWVYEVGRGVSQDYKVAMKWYRLAADQGNRDAQNNIGSMYYKGRGVEKNNSQAERWFRMAAEHGHAFAQESLKELCIDWKAP